MYCFATNHALVLEYYLVAHSLLKVIHKEVTNAGPKSRYRRPAIVFF